MNRVLIVDEAGEGYAADLMAIAKEQRLKLEFRACRTPEQMFQKIESWEPELIVLHHNWSGIEITDILSRLDRSTGGRVRIVVFTGREIKIGEMIKCVRGGVTDYWMKGTLDPASMVRQIEYYCNSDVFTVGKLKMSSEALRVLLNEAEMAQIELTKVQLENEGLQREVEVQQTEEHRQMTQFKVRGAKSVCFAALLVVAYWIVSRITLNDRVTNLGFTIIVALLLLFTDGRLESFLLNWKEGKAVVNAASDGSNKSGK